MTSVLSLLLGCTAGWNRVVQYSAEPAEHSVTAEVFREVLVSLTESDSIAVDHFGAPARLGESMSAAHPSAVPAHWADTLKNEVRVALSDLAPVKPADSTELLSAARSLGVVLLPRDTNDWPVNSTRARVPRLWLSRPGFNRDSTIAAVRIDYVCGPLCGVGETLLLARKPGKRWRIWHSFVHVIA